MTYQSTRNPEIQMTASQVIARGISPEGGLFVPREFPKMEEMLAQMARMDYKALAETIFRPFLSDFSEEEISNCVREAYRSDKFGGEEPVKLVPLTSAGPNAFLLELWHGPTCAFKDMALQILPHFLTTSLQKSAPGRSAVILVATSGDTGKAALEGFRDVPGVKIGVFYPRDGVSPMQKRQMATQEGNNVFVCAIEGNFDDAQTTVKKIFTDPGMIQRLNEHGYLFSSANSINWGRLLPQVVYYFYSYFQLFCTNRISFLKDEINIVVPTGNFGNILAAYYAKSMGLPVKKLICASNANNVLTDFIRTGVYDRRRAFYATSSPSMDILVSSNLERLLFALSGESHAKTAGWMRDLAETGVYQVDPDTLSKVQTYFYGGFCSEERTSKTIREIFNTNGYLCDPHTAVGVDVYKQYVAETGDEETPAVIASTASPFKFSKSVLSALEPVRSEDEYDMLARLEALSGLQAPEPLCALKAKPVRFRDVISKDGAAGYVLDALKIGRG